MPDLSISPRSCTSLLWLQGHGVAEQSDELSSWRSGGRTQGELAGNLGSVLEDVTFTNWAEKERAEVLFNQVSGNQLRGVTDLDFKGMPAPTELEASWLGGCLSLCANLQRLILGSMGIQDHTLAALCRQLHPKALPSLKWLFLDDNGIGDAGAQALARAATQGALASLENLILLRNSVRDEGAGALAQAGVQGALANLSYFSLSKNSVGDAGAGALASATGQGAFPMLKDLFLAQNQIGDAGAEALAAQISGGRLTKRVDLKGNRIGAAGRQALVNAGQHPYDHSGQQEAGSPEHCCRQPSVSEPLPLARQAGPCCSIS